MNQELSSLPCGCDPGVPYKSPDCKKHKVEIKIQHRDSLTGFQREKTVGRLVLTTVEPEPDVPTTVATAPAVAPNGGHPRFFELLDEMAAMHRSKMHDYAKSSDPLSNLRRSESFGIEPWRGTLVRMSDKWSRIEELSTGKIAKNESLRDSLFDLAAYSLLCLILLEDADVSKTR